MQHRAILSSSSSRPLRGSNDTDSWEWPTCQSEYVLLEQVGKGATAEVWIAYCQSLDALAAVKKFYPLKQPTSAITEPDEVQLSCPSAHSGLKPACLSLLVAAQMSMHLTSSGCLAGPSGAGSCGHAPAQTR